MPNKPLSKEEMQARIKRVENYKESHGLNIQQCCKKLGITFSNYYRWKQRVEEVGDAQPAAVQVVEHDVPRVTRAPYVRRTHAPVAPLMMVAGTPEQLAEFYRELNNGGR